MKRLFFTIIIFSFFCNTPLIYGNNIESEAATLTIYINKASISNETCKVEILLRLRFSEDIPMYVNKDIIADFREGTGIVLYCMKDSVSYTDLIMRDARSVNYVKIKENLEIITTIEIDLCKIYPKDGLFDENSKKFNIPNDINKDFGIYNIQAMYYDQTEIKSKVLKGPIYSNTLTINYTE